LSNESAVYVTDRSVIPVRGLGYQIYMTDEDEVEFLQAVRASGDVVLVGLPWHEPKPRLVEGIPPWGAQDPWGGIVFLWNRSLGGGFRAVPIERGPNTGLLNVDANLAPAFRFVRPPLARPGTLGSPVLNAVVSFQVAIDRPVESKPEAVLAWYRTVTTWLTKRYARWERHFLVGPGAARWQREGGQFV
jgi:hypothetical protein